MNITADTRNQQAAPIFVSRFFKFYWLAYNKICSKVYILYPGRWEQLAWQITLTLLASLIIIDVAQLYQKIQPELTIFIEIFHAYWKTDVGS